MYDAKLFWYRLVTLYCSIFGVFIIIFEIIYVWAYQYQSISGPDIIYVWAYVAARSISGTVSQTFGDSTNVSTPCAHRFGFYNTFAGDTLL